MEQESAYPIQTKVDNGPEGSGVHTRFPNRMASFPKETKKRLQLLYYPPYHSRYGPIGRCRGLPEKHWNGTKPADAETMPGWAAGMKWKGLHPVAKINKKNYEKRIPLTKSAMRPAEKFLAGNPSLPKWDILIDPQMAG